MKISLVSFLRDDGTTALIRGFGVIASPEQFREAIEEGLFNLRANELFLVLGVQGKPETYSKDIVTDLLGEYIDFTVDHPEIMEHRLVKILSAEAVILTRMWYGSAQTRPKGVEFGPDDETWIAKVASTEQSAPQVDRK